MPRRDPTLQQRLYLEYTSRGRAHTLEYRFNPPLATTDLVGVAGAIAYLYATIMLNDDSFYAASYSPIGTGVRFPLPFGVQAGLNTVAGNVYGIDPESIQLSITGKGSASGARWSTRFFTAYNNGSGTYPPSNRYKASDLAGTLGTWFTDVLRVLGGTYPGVPRVVAIDSSFILPNNYVNTCFNGYVQRKQRREG